MPAAWTLYVLMKVAPLSWLACIGLVIYQAIVGPDRFASGPILLTAAMGITGGVCYAISRFRADTAGLLLAALLATRGDGPPPAPHLAAVPSPAEATRSSTRAAAG